MPAVRCPHCNSLEIRLHCADSSGSLRISSTCDLLTCTKCGNSWGMKNNDGFWQTGPRNMGQARDAQQPLGPTDG